MFNKHVVGLLLAAGKSQRFGTNKLLYKINNEAMVVTAAKKLKAVLPDTIAIIRPCDEETKILLENEGLTVLECEHSEQGMGHSLAYGVNNSLQAKGWLITLADMPYISQQTIQTVADTLSHGASIAIPVHKRRRGHPIGFCHKYKKALCSLTEDMGAREIIALNRNTLIEIDVDDPGILIDVDRR